MVTIGWNAIKEKYNVCLKLVKEIDDKYKTNYQAEIQDAIIKCSKNEVYSTYLCKMGEHMVHTAVFCIGSNQCQIPIVTYFSRVLYCSFLL